ncbi:uncharacterized protein LOC142575025 [Dermacentor variabilis]|uniref:uncharacterized protein LOC142575025 n=1 Tax=Dermacentor variabilis TaxID=34621 RepID=UPI003F5BCB3C
MAKFFVKNILLRYGATEVVIIDRGTSFTAELTRAIVRYSQTSHRRATAYHPQTNGLTESVTPSPAASNARRRGAQGLECGSACVTFAYNRTVPETTHITPFKLVHGWNPTTTIDAILPHGTDEENVDFAS